MLLTPIGTDEEFHAASDEVAIPRVAKILHPFIDTIEIHIVTLSHGFG